MKCRKIKIKFLDQNAYFKNVAKEIFATKTKCKNASFIFPFPETQQTRNVSSEAIFLYLDERKKQTWQALITQTGKGMKKIVLKQGVA